MLQTRQSISCNFLRYNPEERCTAEKACGKIVLHTAVGSLKGLRTIKYIMYYYSYTSDAMYASIFSALSSILKSAFDRCGTIKTANTAVKPCNSACPARKIFPLAPPSATGPISPPNSRHERKFGKFRGERPRVHHVLRERLHFARPASSA